MSAMDKDSHPDFFYEHPLTALELLIKQFSQLHCAYFGL